MFMLNNFLYISFWDMLNLTTAHTCLFTACVLLFFWMFFFVGQDEHYEHTGFGSIIPAAAGCLEIYHYYYGSSPDCSWMGEDNFFFSLGLTIFVFLMICIQRMSLKFNLLIISMKADLDNLYESGYGTIFWAALGYGLFWFMNWDVDTYFYWAKNVVLVYEGWVLLYPFLIALILRSGFLAALWSDFVYLVGMLGLCLLVYHFWIPLKYLAIFLIIGGGIQTSSPLKLGNGEILSYVGGSIYRGGSGHLWERLTDGWFRRK